MQLDVMIFVLEMGECRDLRKVNDLPDFHQIPFTHTWLLLVNGLGLTRYRVLGTIRCWNTCRNREQVQKRP